MMTALPAVLAGLAVTVGVALVVVGRQYPAWTASDVATWPLLRALRLDRRRADLAVLEESLEGLLLLKACCGLLGLLAAPVAVAVMATLGRRTGIGLPSLAAVALTVVLFLAPDVGVRARAARARQELRRAACAFLDLVALERGADAGVAEAVERVAGISDAPPFVRIRRAVVQAQLNGATPWHGLRDLADETGVVELGDLADIMASSGRDGAAVCTSLRARAAALRTAITAAETAAANTRSEYMAVPVAALGLVFMALLAYPAMVRLVTGT